METHLPIPTQALPKINGTPFAACVSATQSSKATNMQAT
jgi:hypothetical protein